MHLNLCIATYYYLKQNSSFRAAIKYDKKNKKIGWYMKPEEVFDNCGYILLRELMRTYKTHQMSKDSNLWRILFDTVDRDISRNNIWVMYDIPDKIT